MAGTSPAMTGIVPASISLVGVNRIDRTAPLAVIFVEQVLRRRAASRDALVERIEIARLVLAGAVEALAPLQPGASELQDFHREVAHRAAGNDGAKRQFRHRIAETLPFVGIPRLDQIPSRIQRNLVVENTGPKSRQGQQIRQSAGIGAAHFEITLEPDFGEYRAQMIGPV